MLVEARCSTAMVQAAALAEALAELGETRWSVVEDVVAQTARVQGFFNDEREARAAWSGLQAQLPRSLRSSESPQCRALADADWRESYKAHFHAWRCGRLHWVPEWERTTHRVPRGEVAVFLDPGMAFGTGNHATTRLCCERLVEFAQAQRRSSRARRSWRVIDAGCGSGILAISAVKLGARSAFAFDNDPGAIAIARENARRNRVAARVRMACRGIDAGLQRRQSELVLANIQADVLQQHAAALLCAVAPHGALVLSGILARELADVRKVFTRSAGRGWSAHSRRRGEWADLMLRRT